MKAILIDQFVDVSPSPADQDVKLTIVSQKIEDVKISEVPNPEVKDGEVLVRIEAAGVNFVDLLYVCSSYLLLPNSTFSPPMSSDLTSIQILLFHVSISIFIFDLYQPCPKARGKHQNNRSLVTPPFILGLEFAGTVISSPTSFLPPGSRVLGGATGSYASHISVDPSSLHLIPKGWTFAEAAGLAGEWPSSKFTYFTVPSPPPSPLKTTTLPN